jgi:hypothetical protein
VIPADLPEPDAALPPAMAAIEEALEETLSLVRVRLGAPQTLSVALPPDLPLPVSLP